MTLINANKFKSLPPDLRKAVMDVGREFPQRVSLSTAAEYAMSIDTVDLSGVKRGALSAADQKKIAIYINVALMFLFPGLALWLPRLIRG